MRSRSVGHTPQVQALLDIPAPSAPTYAGNDPVNHVDPDGRESFSASVKHEWNDSGILPEKISIKLADLTAKMTVKIEKKKIKSATCKGNSSWFDVDGWEQYGSLIAKCTSVTKNQAKIDVSQSFKNEAVCPALGGGSTYLSLRTTFTITAKKRVLQLKTPHAKSGGCTGPIRWQKFAVVKGS